MKNVQCFLLPLPCLPPQGFAVFLPLSWDHPRIRGEHPLLIQHHAASIGSSPHPRGTLRKIGTNRILKRIIPASAGNTHLFLHMSGLRGDHPRIRGEHVLEPYGNVAGKGSSPHPRGTLSAQRVKIIVAGIIPASAGNTTR